ncbi:MAG: hypothetical protein EXR72_27090 [Myxococcales bacterium]|nr:hypothetical protein [Myxococcales bacterium]
MRAPFLLLLALAACSGDPPPPSEVPSARERAPDPRAVHVAGSGAMAPLARALAAACGAACPLPVVVEESIGSGGGVRAAADGAVDVGMISRPLGEAERRLDLMLVPGGMDAVVIAANAEVRVDGIAGTALRDLHAGLRRTLGDGSPATVLLRDRGESANGALDRAVPGLGAARDLAYARGRMRVLYHDRSMVEALVATPGAIGVTSLGALTAGHPALKVLALDGLRPSVATLADGTWPAARPLAWVLRRDRAGRARPFLDFAASPEGARIARRCGYLPAVR